MFVQNPKDMKTRMLIIFLLFFCKTLLSGQTIAERIMPPEGYVRTEVAANSFASYLRRLPLQPEGSKVLLYNGETKRNQLPAYAVVDLDIGKRDLQQCADAVIRLRAEYLYEQKQYAAIHFNFTNGFNAEYTKWAKGSRIRVNGNTVSWYPSKGEDYSYKTFRSYLDMVFSYAGTTSLSKELAPVNYLEMKIGDVFIQGGHPGQAVIGGEAELVPGDIRYDQGVELSVHLEHAAPVQGDDAAVPLHPGVGALDAGVVQGHRPVAHRHPLPVNRKKSPWYELSDSDDGKVYTPEWIFNKKDLKQFK